MPGPPGVNCKRVRPATLVSSGATGTARTTVTVGFGPHNCVPAGGIRCRVSGVMGVNVRLRPSGAQTGFAVSIARARRARVCQHCRGRPADRLPLGELAGGTVGDGGRRQLTDAFPGERQRGRFLRGRDEVRLSGRRVCGVQRQLRLWPDRGRERRRLQSGDDRYSGCRSVRTFGTIAGYQLSQTAATFVLATVPAGGGSLKILYTQAGNSSTPRPGTTLTPTTNRSGRRTSPWCCGTSPARAAACSPTASR